MGAQYGTRMQLGRTHGAFSWTSASRNLCLEAASASCLRLSISLMVYVHPWFTQMALEALIFLAQTNSMILANSMSGANGEAWLRMTWVLQICSAAWGMVMQFPQASSWSQGRTRSKGWARHAASSVGLKYLQASRDWSNHNGVWRPFSHRRLGGSRCCPPYDAMIDGMCWSGPIARARTALSALPTAMAFLAQEGNMRGSDSL